MAVDFNTILHDYHSANGIVGWTIRVVLVILVAFVVPNLQEGVLHLLDMSVTRFAILLAVLALSLWDPASALLFAMAFVVGILTLNKFKLLSLGNTMAIQSPHESYANFFEKLVAEVPSTASTASPSKSFTEPSQFEDIQSNFIGGVDNQKTEVKTWEHELSPQGLASPQGYNIGNDHLELFN